MVEVLQLNLPLSQENVCICAPPASLTDVRVTEQVKKNNYIFVINLQDISIIQ